MASLRSPTYSAQATRLRHAINHSTCSTPSPFRCSDYMTTPITYCYIFRPPGKWFWTILHATSSLFARWTPLVERKPDSKESGIESLRQHVIALTDCALRFLVAQVLQTFFPHNILDQIEGISIFSITLYEKHSLDARHPVEQKYHPRRASRRQKEIRAPTRLANYKRCYQNGPRLCEITSFRLPHTKKP